MTDNNGWPDADKPGVPLEPERDGWHWLRTPYGEEAPYYWCAAGKCERGRWPSRWADVSENEWPPTDCAYLSPCLTPSEIAAREAAAWIAGRDAAAADADCGCAARQDVMARYAREGHKRASYLCSNGDACCALQAASIRSLTPPADFAAALGAGDA